jgi:hypothetical protein
MHISCRTGFDATIVVLTLLSVICIVDAWLYTVVVCLVMKVQALLSTQNVALHAGVLSQKQVTQNAGILHSSLLYCAAASCDETS